MRFNDKELWLIERALIVAGQQYDQDAKTMATEKIPRLAEQFQRQADDAARLLVKIQEG